MIRQLPRLLIVALCVLSYATPAHADTYTVTSASDLFFTVTEPTNFTVRTYAWDQHRIDSMLWLYGPDGNLVAQNDDYYGLDSRIAVTITGNGTYRLRTGVCCGDPNRWYGDSYQIVTDLIADIPTTTTTEPSTTTTTTTSTLPETTTTEVTTTWVPSTTSTIPETTTTTTVPEPTVPATTTTSTTTLPPTSSTSTSVPETTIPETSSVAPSASSLAPPTSRPAPTVTPPVTSTQPPTPSSTVAPETTTPPTTVPASDPTSPPDPSISPSDSLPDAVVTEPPADAPDAVKAQFEAEVNIFDGTHDDYVPVGSTITVAERRTLTTVSVTMGVIPTTPRRNKK